MQSNTIFEPPKHFSLGLIITASMESPEDEIDTRKRNELTDLFLNYLRAVAEKAKAELGHDLKRLQQSIWWECNDDGSEETCTVQRDIIDNQEILKRYQQTWKHEEFPEKQQLVAALFIWFSETEVVLIMETLRSLLFWWLKHPKPFEFEEPITSNLLNEFIEYILEGTTVANSRFVIEGLKATYLPLVFEEGIMIREITEEELWDLGNLDLARFVFPLNPVFPPKDSWKILEVTLKHNMREANPNPYIIFEAVLALLRLGSTGAFQTIDLGTETKFVSGRSFAINSRPKSEYFSGNYDLSEDLSHRIQESWPSMRKIMESDSHYLRLPAQRLLEGSERKRFEDAILDYSIGLERLLTEGDKRELSYRFALRGATILSWNGGDKKIFFDGLKKFYGVRSSIVHGSKVKEGLLNDAYIDGEKYLRKIWWWYFENGFIHENDLKKGSHEVDRRILSNSTDNISCRGSRHE